MASVEAQRVILTLDFIAGSSARKLRSAAVLNSQCCGGRAGIGRPRHVEQGVHTLPILQFIPAVEIAIWLKRTWGCSMALITTDTRQVKVKYGHYARGLQESCGATDFPVDSVLRRNCVGLNRFVDFIICHGFLCSGRGGC